MQPGQATRTHDYTRHGTTTLLRADAEQRGDHAVSPAPLGAVRESRSHRGAGAASARRALSWTLRPQNTADAELVAKRPRSTCTSTHLRLVVESRERWCAVDDSSSSAASQRATTESGDSGVIDALTNPSRRLDKTADEILASIARSRADPDARAIQLLSRTIGTGH